MNIVIFEDKEYLNLLPTVYFQPVWELQCGIDTLGRKIIRYLNPQSVHFTARDYLSKYYSPPDSLFQTDLPGEFLFINGRILLQKTDLIKFNAISKCVLNRF